MSTPEESHLKVLRLLEANPHLSQRDLAEALGISVGKANYCLKALIDKGLIKAGRFRNSNNKLAYAYLLTPSGIASKTELTVKYLRLKMQEFDALKKEIAQLKKDAELERQKRQTIFLDGTGSNSLDDS